MVQEGVGFALSGRVNFAILLVALALNSLAGCASLTNPVANGVPVRLVPPELLGEPKANMEALSLTSLRQPPPDNYLLAPEDVLGIWIDGILGEKGQAPPVRFSEIRKLPPALGLPIPVRGDGTISLPFVAPIKVEGMTLEQAEQAIRKSYTVDKQILVPGRERIFVTLEQPRQYHILVIRQDSAIGANAAASSGNFGGQATGFVVGVGGASSGVRKGQGFAIDLPAYENDVLNALARTGGFPGTDAVNEIIIERGAYKGRQGRTDLMNMMKAAPIDAIQQKRGEIIRIPLRVRPGEQSPITPEMITLETGDVVYIEARDGDIYYTGGLLPPGSHLLPRDVDLDVVEAIVRNGGVINSGGVSALNTSGTTTSGGLGSPSPSLVTIVRRLPDGGQLAIRVDLNRALRDPRERILIQPKDLIMLQEEPQEAITRYLTNVIRLPFAYTLTNGPRLTSSVSGSVP